MRAWPIALSIGIAFAPSTDPPVLSASDPIVPGYERYVRESYRYQSQDAAIAMVRLRAIKTSVYDPQGNQSMSRIDLPIFFVPQCGRAAPEASVLTL
jgi:hypothetical protein